MNPLKCAIIVNSGRDSPSQVNHGATEADSEKKAKSAVVFAYIVAVETLYVSKRTEGKYVWQNLFFSHKCYVSSMSLSLSTNLLNTILQINTYSLKLFGDG